MPGNNQRGLSDAESEAIATLVREELARRHITRHELAVQAKISLSTLEKALSGSRPFTLATIVRLEEALARSLRPAPAHNDTPAAAPAGLAPEDMGSYARRAVGWIEGAYLTLRPSFGDAQAIYAYRTQIAWDEPGSHLAFRESERVDAAFTQWGTVSVPLESGHIYLVTNRHGQYRLIVVARPTIEGQMHGILTTLQAGRGAQLTPIATPIAFVPMQEEGTERFGRITPADPEFKPYAAVLKRTVEEPYALFLNR